MLDEIKNDAEVRMRKSIEMLSQELAKLRTGRAHPSLLDSVKAEYYGQLTPLNQVASIVVEDSRTLTVTPFEKSMVITVEKAMRSCDLGVNPTVAGQVIRVPLPPLTEERRQVLTKQMKAEAENARIAIRNIRREANKKVESLLKSKLISEDDDRRNQDKMQKLTDRFVKQIDQMAHDKETDLMQI